MAVITGFSVEKNISSSKQLIGFTKYRFSLHLKINIIISEEDNILLALSSPLLSLLSLHFRLPGGRSSVAGSGELTER